MARVTTFKQPIEFDEHGVIRFKQNRLVNHLVDNYNLNKLLIEFDMDDENNKKDYEQLMQLVGYSLSGYCDLDNVSERSKDEAWEIVEVSR